VLAVRKLEVKGNAIEGKVAKKERGTRSSAEEDE